MHHIKALAEQASGQASSPPPGEGPFIACPLGKGPFIACPPRGPFAILIKEPPWTRNSETSQYLQELVFHRIFGNCLAVHTRTGHPTQFYHQPLIMKDSSRNLFFFFQVQTALFSLRPGEGKEKE